MGRRNVKWEMSPCPKCSSRETGSIRVSDEFTSKRILLREAELINEGSLTKTVSPEEWRTYYSKYGINAFCSSCGYEFKGTLQKVVLNDEEELIAWEAVHGIMKARQLCEKRERSFFSVLASYVRRAWDNGDTETKDPN